MNFTFWVIYVPAKTARQDTMQHQETPEYNATEEPTLGQGHVFLDMDQVRQRTSLSRSAIYRKIDSGEFPKPVNLGGRRVAFVEAEIIAWQERLMEARA